MILIDLYPRGTENINTYLKLSDIETLRRMVGEEMRGPNNFISSWAFFERYSGKIIELMKGKGDTAESMPQMREFSKLLDLGV